MPLCPCPHFRDLFLWNFFIFLVADPQAFRKLGMQSVSVSAIADPQISDNPFLRYFYILKFENLTFIEPFFAAFYGFFHIFLS